MERKEYKIEEVALNNGQNGSRTWIILWGIVYDVTDYLDQHPGGGELITEFAGMDATAGFDDFGHSSDAKKMLRKYEIGILAKIENNKSKSKKPLKDVTNDDNISIKKPNLNQRRNFFRVILGPCAST